MMMRAETETLFSRWVTLIEQKWITFRERRSRELRAESICSEIS
jgi:hypothetical protein